ncbi:hypothetical protein SAMN05216224_101379 [Thioclava dalianensis]|nr:hypothetical protein [Thioclava dalianensis]SFM80287.1 hypothetical protein SAMN05216224_101379 [Thioclava dalianensis]
MSKQMIRLIENRRLVDAAHWATFCLGAIALTASVTATALKVLSS